MITIYKITNPEEKVYVGQTIDFDRRIKQHIQCAKEGIGFNLQDSIRKYGFESHLVEILEQYEGEKSYEKENYWIKYYDSVNKGLNITWGHGGLGRKKSEQEIKKHAISRSVKVYRYSLIGEYIDSFDSQLIASKRSECSYCGISQCAMGKIVTCGGYIWRYYKKDKIDVFVNRIKPFYAFDMNGVMIGLFTEIKTASEKLLAQSTNISRCLMGKRKTANGYRFVYQNKSEDL